MGNRINKLEKRLHDAQANRQYGKALLLMQELEKAKALELSTERVSLFECTEGDKELRHKLCVKMIEMTVCSDLLYDKIMEFEEALPKSVVSLDYIERMKKLHKDAHDAVAFIDLYGLPALSEHYASMVEEVEEKLLYQMGNVVANIVQKRLNLT